VLGHIFMFMATVDYPDTRVGLSDMISGFVDRRWAPVIAAPRDAHQPRPALALDRQPVADAS
jgi:hypothetical protein